LTTFYPLILRIPHDPDDAKPCTKCTELLPCQGLHQDVGDLLLSADVLNVHSPFLQHTLVCPFPNTLSYEVKYDVYVLASLMKNEILTEGDCRLTVHLEKKWCVLPILQLDEQLRQPSRRPP
jgi:hypothetical protein